MARFKAADLKASAMLEPALEAENAKRRVERWPQPYCCSGCKRSFLRPSPDVHRCDRCDDGPPPDRQARQARDATIRPKGTPYSPGEKIRIHEEKLNYARYMVAEGNLEPAELKRWKAALKKLEKDIPTPQPRDKVPGPAAIVPNRKGKREAPPPPGSNWVGVKPRGKRLEAEAARPLGAEPTRPMRAE